MFHSAAPRGSGTSIIATDPQDEVPSRFGKRASHQGWRHFRPAALPVLLCAWLVLGALASNAGAADPKAEWEMLNQQVMEGYRAGRVRDVVPIAEQALALARKEFGPSHPDTLPSMENLAMILRPQGR